MHFENWSDVKAAGIKTWPTGNEDIKDLQFKGSFVLRPITVRLNPKFFPDDTIVHRALLEIPGGKKYSIPSSAANALIIVRDRLSKATEAPALRAIDPDITWTVIRTGRGRNTRFEAFYDFPTEEADMPGFRKKDLTAVVASTGKRQYRPPEVRTVEISKSYQVQKIYIDKNYPLQPGWEKVLTNSGKCTLGQEEECKCDMRDLMSVGHKATCHDHPKNKKK